MHAFCRFFFNFEEESTKINVNSDVLHNQEFQNKIFVLFFFNLCHYMSNKTSTFKMRFARPFFHTFKRLNLIQNHPTLGWFLKVVHIFCSVSHCTCGTSCRCLASLWLRRMWWSSRPPACSIVIVTSRFKNLPGCRRFEGWTDVSRREIVTLCIISVFLQQKHGWEIY